MSKHPSVVLVSGGIAEYQRKQGISRGYPPSSLPDVEDPVVYSLEEIEALNKPLIYHAREGKK